MSFPPRVDVHSHFLPPFYREALLSHGYEKVDGMPAIPEWSVSSHLEIMETLNIKKAILSISSPGTNLEHASASTTVALTRQCNAYAADVKREHPDKFGFWASLPLPDVDAALEEIDKAVADGADGFALLSNYSSDYLGDAKFDRVFDRLNELGSVVFIHPTQPCMQCGNPADNPALPFANKYPVPIFEFFFDAARAVVNLLYSGTVARCKDVTFILPHAGGVLPPMLSRVTAFGALVPGVQKIDPKSINRQIAEQVYFDLAGVIFEGTESADGSGQLKALVKGLNISHEKLLYGSDFPFTAKVPAKILANSMKDGLEKLFNDGERGEIYQKNAEKLLSKKGLQRRKSEEMIHMEKETGYNTGKSIHNVAVSICTYKDS